MAKRISIEDRQRGRDAERPSEIPKPGWKDILLRTKQEAASNSIGLVAAGVAFYALLAIFPALAAVISIYGLAADPADIERQMTSAMTMVPAEAANILKQQLQSLASQPRGGLSIGVAVGILLALWSAASGIKALIQGLNIAYDEQERRGFFKLNGVALLLTLGGILFAILALGLIAVLPAAVNLLNLSGPIAAAISLLSWPLLLVAVTVALAVIYRYGPSRQHPRWRWVSWGAGAATALWLVASIIFSVYVANFGSYGKTYGSVGAIVILMMWFYLTAYSILLGAELNAEIEHQTMRDSTTGAEKPMGGRGAYVADTVGKRQR
jgi:membrane protein